MKIKKIIGVQCSCGGYLIILSKNNTAISCDSCGFTLYIKK